jgi:integrase
MKLTAIKVSKLSKPGRYGDGGGLWLQVSGTGGKSWLFRYTMRKAARQMGLGSFNTITLAQAREAALRARQSLLSGIDPITARQQHASRLHLAMTFKDCAEGYILSHRDSWRSAVHALQWAVSLKTYVYPLIGALPVNEVNTGWVMRILEPIWQKKPETASRIRGRIEVVLSWAKARGHRTGDNPAAWRGHLDQLLPARKKMARVKHHAALPYAEIGDFMSELRHDEDIAARALEFLILTASRTSEVTGSLWAEIDLEKRQWIIPPERMKAGREHRVALSKQAVQLLETLPRQSKSIFPIGRNAMLLKLNSMRGTETTVHGFRSSFSDWASEQTNFPRDLCEIALAHVVGNATELAYPARG